MAPPSGLTLNVEAPHTIDVNVQDFNITTTITNNTGNTLTLVNDPSSILTHKYPTERHHVIHSSGAKPVFKGIKIKFSPKIAADLGHVTILQPGQSITSVTVTHNLSRAHDFRYPGNGQYTIKPKSTFYVVDPVTGGVHLLKGDAFSSVTVHVSGIEVPVNEPEEGAEKDTTGGDTGKEAAEKEASGMSGAVEGLVGDAPEPPTPEIKFDNCTDDQKPAITAAANNAVDYINSCKTYIDGMTASTTRFTTWFGNYADDRKKTMKLHFEKMGTKPKNMTYDASNTDPTVYAYVYPEDDTKIYLCGAFWKAPATGTNSQAGTLVHETSHFTSTAGTSDLAYGQAACKNLAKSAPGDAVRNADSHEYFAENDPEES